MATLDFGGKPALVRACHPRGTKLDALALHRRYFAVREPNYLAARCALLHPVSDKPGIDLFDLVSVPLADGTSRLQTLIQSRLRGTQPRFAATPPKAQESARHSTMNKKGALLFRLSWNFLLSAGVFRGSGTHDLHRVRSDADLKKMPEATLRRLRGDEL